MKTVFLLLLLIHGLIHLLGFAKAFQIAEVGQLTRPVPKVSGVFWLLASVLFVASFFLLLLNNHSWWIIATIAVVCSQILIVQNWADARFGTLANVIILVPIVISFLSALPSSYSSIYQAEVKKRLSPRVDSTLLSETDIGHLPAPVQRYLHFVGAVGRPRVHNVRVVFTGMMKRTMTSSWMDIHSQQYNFFDDPARMFYIESVLYGIPFDGLHAYAGDSATMQIKVASLFQVVDARGEKMTRGETVTLFNDMCLLAPASLIDTSIRWEDIDSQKLKATFTNKGNTINAVLSFGQNGELTNFLSNDRFLSADGVTYTSYPWSTPVKDYRDFGGRKVPAYAEAIWHTPEGEYLYARFTLEVIEYNCRDFK